MKLEWFETLAPRDLWYLAQKGNAYPYFARVERRLGKWSLEMWRPIEGGNPKRSDGFGWEFVARFEDLEEAKRVGLTLARIEN